MAEIIQLPIPAGAPAEEWAHFDMVLGLTEDLLPVVSNPRAAISPDSKMQALGKTPSIYNAQRKVAGLPGWTDHRATPEEIARWSRERDYGICLQTRRVRALDVDIDDPQLAAAVHAHLAPLGLPVRQRGNAAKFLLAFEMTGELFKRRLRCANGMIELLATGQQFIASGTHPSGARYEWATGLPDAFPVLSLADVDRIWQELQDTFGVAPATESQASVRHTKIADVYQSDPVARFLVDGAHVRSTGRDGAIYITCPFEQDHTTDSGPTATAYFPPHTKGYAQGHFHCLHAHCEDRQDQEFLDALGFINEALANEFAAIADSAAAGSDPASSEPAAIVAEGPAGLSPAKPARFTFQQAAEFVASGKPQRWLIQDVLPQAELGVVFGESGAGKSFVTLDMLADLALGTPWRGKDVTQSRVAYIAAEGARGVRKRLKAIAQVRGVALGDIAIHVLADAPNLMERGDALEIAKAVVAMGGAQVVVIDTLAQATPGANENSGEDMGKAMAHCKGIHRATGALVLLVHHSGKDPTRGARGWSGIKGALDVELEVTKAGEKRSLYVSKMKDGEDGMEFPFRLQSVVVGVDEAQHEEVSCVVEHAGEPAGRAGRDRGPKGAVEKLVLQQLEELHGLGNGVFVGDLVAAAVGQMVQEEGKRDRRSFRVHRALEGLQAAARVRVEGGKVVLS
jgi:hypothetical protein